MIDCLLHKGSSVTLQGKLLAAGVICDFDKIISLCLYMPGTYQHNFCLGKYFRNKRNQNSPSCPITVIHGTMETIPTFKYLAPSLTPTLRLLENKLNSASYFSISQRFLQLFFTFHIVCSQTHMSVFKMVY